MGFTIASIYIDVRAFPLYTLIKIDLIEAVLVVVVK
jgi:hypothetical protein